MVQNAREIFETELCPPSFKQILPHLKLVGKVPILFHTEDFIRTEVTTYVPVEESMANVLGI